MHRANKAVDMVAGVTLEPGPKAVRLTMAVRPFRLARPARITGRG